RIALFIQNSFILQLPQYLITLPELNHLLHQALLLSPQSLGLLQVLEQRRTPSCIVEEVLSGEAFYLWHSSHFQLVSLDVLMPCKQVITNKVPPSSPA